jgi:hypothetical protein
MNCSHLVIATDDVPAMERSFRYLFEIEPHFSNPEFCDFVLPSRFRIAFFRPVGAAAKYFDAGSNRKQISIGVTVPDVDATYARATAAKGLAMGISTSGPPKEHPWGEKSFLLIDSDSNRWEITQSPSEDGLLVNRPT